MAKEPTFSCDAANCPSKRGASNHWLIGWTVKGIKHKNGRMGKPGYALSDWDERRANQPGVQHFCSNNCALKVLHLHIRQTNQGV